MTRTVTVVLFEGYELLDMAGPVELLSQLRDEFTLQFVGPEAGPVMSAQGLAIVADKAWLQADPGEILLVPGGRGTRQLVKDPVFLDWLNEFGVEAELITSVCTGSALLAAAGLLGGRRATTNKKSFAWVESVGHDVHWVPRARWVEDGNRWTSSGVAAGMDMYAEIIRRLAGEEVGRKVTNDIELDTHDDAGWDPFAAIHGAGAQSEKPRTPVVEDDDRDAVLGFMHADREALRGWLDMYRATIPFKLGGLTAEELCRRSVPPSSLSLIGIVRHMNHVEAYWFQEIARGDSDYEPNITFDPTTDDDFDDVDPATAFADLDAWAAEVEHSREAEASITDLDAPVAAQRHGKDLNLRWIMIHMIEEYARHLGHIDMLREAIDGQTGY